MTFQEFVAIKQAQAIAEHLETLGEAEAVELLNQLDESTVELVEAILNEFTAKTIRKIFRRADRGEISQKAAQAAYKHYKKRPREETEFSRSAYGVVSPQVRQKERRFRQKFKMNPDGVDSGDPYQASERSRAAREASRFDPQS